MDFSKHKTFYPRVLANKDFTYALFRKLAKDFNGDMFSDVEDEEQVVAQKHLTLLQDLLFGDAGLQKKLFFYSYRFDIIPLDLISSIYEEFYHSSTKAADKKSKARHDGAYYTPAVLVEFVLARVLTESVLKKNPRILDPACGSGIFLVEAFRRVVRHQWHHNRRPPTFDELRSILKHQIAGIEVNPEAAKIAAFSLYLSMLHYLDRPAIAEQIKNGNKLPNLVASTSSSHNHFHCILPENAFDTCTIESRPLWRNRFGSACADVVVGNPPWGAPGKKAAVTVKARHEVMLKWCDDNDKPISNKEPSQAFLWRALDLLTPNGKAGMLVSSGVLFKHSSTSQAFRTQWLDNAQLTEVFNFAHVRKLFFRGAISPFLAIAFTKAKQNGSPVHYWSTKQTRLLNGTQAIVLSIHDRSILVDEPFADKKLWKTHLWGSHSDWRFLTALRSRFRLGNLVDRRKCGQGFKESPPTRPASELASYRALPVRTFSRYDVLDASSAPPKRVYRLGAIASYEGPRLLLERGIRESGHVKGQIVCRYADEPFCFSSALIGLKLSQHDELVYKVVLGVLWSSFARYFFFLTSSTWGIWHDEIDLDSELLQLPIVLEKTNPTTTKIVAIVDKLLAYHPQELQLAHPHGKTTRQIEAQRRKWEQQLDEAVFELYGLSEEQKDLIRDCCEISLPFLYKPFDSVGAMAAIDDGDHSWMELYTHVFCRRWQPYLGDNEEMRAELHLGAHGNMVAVEFYPTDKNDPWDLVPKDDWGHVLQQLSRVLPTPMGTSQIVLDGMVHVVSDRGIIIIKRNEKRLWTRSLAREDADSTLTEQMVQTMPREGGMG